MKFVRAISAAAGTGLLLSGWAGPELPVSSQSGSPAASSRPADAQEEETMDIWETTYTGELYNERYRNQFHYSPQSGWMNDINGVWYADGLYHMAYQRTKALDWEFSDEIGWGYATSPDLLHWTQRHNLLQAGENCAGAAFSGTAVVDEKNTAGFGAGAYILVYTDTLRGQCLAISVDKGRTFVDYAENPVVTIADPAPGTVVAHQRDPKVFWHEESGRWVMVAFREHLTADGGETMEFFTSPDLKAWTLRSTFTAPDFRECPDMYPLRLEGSDRLYWILQSASTKYFIGEFDGETFTVTEEPGEKLAGGKDIYAGQTFFGLPDERTVSIYWLDCWNGSSVPTTPWRHAATFPTTLTLKRFPEGLRVVRSPIEEIAALYKNTIVRRDRTAGTGGNPLEGFYAPCFDMTVELDIGATRARRINFNLMDKTLAYMPEDQTLYSTDGGGVAGELRIPPVDGKIKLRFLVDADSLEIFCNDGRFSYTEEYGFAYRTKALSLTADKEVPVLLVEFHALDGIW